MQYYISLANTGRRNNVLHCAYRPVNIAMLSVDARRRQVESPARFTTGSTIADDVIAALRRQLSASSGGGARHDGGRALDLRRRRARGQLADRRDPRHRRHSEVSHHAGARRRRASRDRGGRRRHATHRTPATTPDCVHQQPGELICLAFDGQSSRTQYDTIRYEMPKKADMSQLDLPHEPPTKK